MSHLMSCNEPFFNLNAFIFCVENLPHSIYSIFYFNFIIFVHGKYWEYAEYVSDTTNDDNKITEMHTTKRRTVSSETSKTTKEKNVSGYFPVF